MDQSDLHFKGKSESEEDAPKEEGWKDNYLTNAFNSALKMSEVEVAKRLATEGEEEDEARKSKDDTEERIEEIVWLVGSNCRAVYEEDGLEYEAFIKRILDDRECTVKYLGYSNTEQVQLSSLRPSLGDEAQKLQIEQAMLERSEESGYLSDSEEVNMNLPPPPPMPLLSTQDEDLANSSMMCSWYMSGYYTGLYHGLKRSRQSKETQNKRRKRDYCYN